MCTRNMFEDICSGNRPAGGTSSGVLTWYLGKTSCGASVHCFSFWMSSFAAPKATHAGTRISISLPPRRKRVGTRRLASKTPARRAADIAKHWQWVPRAESLDPARSWGLSRSTHGTKAAIAQRKHATAPTMPETSGKLCRRIVPPTTDQFPEGPGVEHRAQQLTTYAAEYLVAHGPAGDLPRAW